MRTIKFSKAELKERLYRRRYLVPNAVTLASMFCGFLTIIYASIGRFDKAIIAIALAILFDGLDGRVARKLHATSRFGVEFDSFADLVSFGVAPALLIYYWCFHYGANEFGVAVCFLYALCAASRLARFNISPENLRSFTGLPTPASAAMVAATVNFAPKVTPGVGVTIWGAALLILLSYLMVSRIEFFSIKSVKFSGARIVFRVLIAAAIFLVWYNHQVGFVTLVGLYCVSGPVGTLIRLLRAKKSAVNAVRATANNLN
jgi:CDP-diacylglycerol--serine O-phosphatidyltransferase